MGDECVNVLYSHMYTWMFLEPIFACRFVPGGHCNILRAMKKGEGLSPDTAHSAFCGVSETVPLRGILCFITRKTPVFTSQVIYCRERKDMAQHVLEADRDDTTERSMLFCTKSHRWEFTESRYARRSYWTELFKVHTLVTFACAVVFIYAVMYARTCIGISVFTFMNVLTRLCIMHGSVHVSIVYALWMRVRACVYLYTCVELYVVYFCVYLQSTSTSRESESS